MHRSYIFLMILIFFILGFSLSLLFVRHRIGDSGTDNVEIAPPRMVSIREYLVPVTSFSDLRQNLTYSALTAEQLCILEESRRSAQQLFPGKEFRIISPEEIESALVNKEICLLDPARVNFRYKSLAVNGMNFWAKETALENYPLAVSYGMSEEESEAFSGTAAELVDPENRSRFFFGGEIIPARAVDRLALNHFNNYTYLFDYFREDISSAELAVALLENPLNGNPTPCTGCMAFVGDEKVAPGLKEVGFDILSLAGNHAGDGGQAGFRRTLEVLQEQGIKYTGAGNSDTGKITPALTEVNGKKIGVVAADSVASYYWNKGGSYFGTNWLSKEMNGTIDRDRVAMIAELKQQYSLDYLIVYMSWGVEYTNKPINFQTELAHALIDNGADLIVASHPHWVQSIEFYKDKPIFYSLGNFIFDQNHSDPTRQGVNLNLYYVGSELKSIELMPHLTCGPYISTNNLTERYLKGEIDRNYLDTNDEKAGCVYFQPRKLEPDNTHYQQIWERLLQHSDIIKYQ